MTKVTAADIKKLRAETGAGVMDAKKALASADGDFAKAEAILKEKNLLSAEKKSDRETSEGLIASYVHNDGKTAALVELQCETDFVARNEDLKTMMNNIAMQVVAMQPTDVTDLLKQDYIRDPQMTVEELVKQASGKLGENLVVSRFIRYQLGEE